MAASTPFQPNTGANGTIGAGISVTLNGQTSVSGTIVPQGNTLMVTNPNTTATIFFRAVPAPNATPGAATTADCPVLPLNRVIVSVPGTYGGTLLVAVVSAVAGSNTAVYFTPGEGGFGQS